MSMVVIVILKGVDAALAIKWDSGFIPRVFKTSINSMKALIISFSLLFFVAVVRVELQSYTYITYIYLLPLIEVVGKLPHIYE